ncbi:MAG: ABC transporter permease [Bacilli bacterium]|nr:ABC transporter permease [Bacilli bacterium]
MEYFINVLLNILTSGLPCCLLAVGIFLTYRLLDFADLTAEGSFLIGGATCVTIIFNGGNPFFATIIGMVGGIICGFITGILHTKLNIPKLLSGIITMTATASIALLIIGTTKEGSAFANLVTLVKENNTIYSVFYNEHIKNQLLESIVMAVIVAIMIVIIYFFFGTEYGMAIRATGMNEKMARAQGINTTTSKIICVMISNGLIGLAGALWAQDARSMDVKSASGFLVVGLAAILIGETIFGKRTFKNWIISVALGGIVYYVIITIAIELGFPTQLKNLLYAILITIALCLPMIKSLFLKIFSKGEKNKEVNNA